MMAGKDGYGTGWNPEQGERLLAATDDAINTLEEEYNKIDRIFKQIRSNEVIGESTTKKPLVQALDNMQASIDLVKDNILKIKGRAKELMDTANESVRANIRNTEEAAEDVAAAGKKAASVDGTGASK